MKLTKKITLVGPFGVGKTSLFKRFIDDSFSEEYKSTLGVQIQKKVVRLNNGQEISLILWDTEGHMELSEGRTAYLLGSHAFVYVFDLTRPETYANSGEQISFLNANFPNTPVKNIGNKLDLVTKKQVTEELEKLNIPYHYLTSAKSGLCVEELFKELAEELVK